MIIKLDTKLFSTPVQQKSSKECKLVRGKESAPSYRDKTRFFHVITV